MSFRFRLSHAAITAASAVLLLSCASQPPVQKPEPVIVPPVVVTVDRSHWVDSVLACMSVEEKIGQMMMVGVSGHYFSSSSDQYARLVAARPGTARSAGIILWRGDVYESALRLNALQTLARLPLLVSADLERGVPMRVRRGTPFPDAMAIGATRNPQYAYDVGRAIALEARALGVHQNYAPVADVNTNPVNPVINTRSFGSDPVLVGSMVEAFIRGTQSAGVLATAKHFPGHGDTGTDSHLDLPSVPYTRARLDSVELVPFRAAVRAGVKSVMIGHLAVPALDASRSVPSSLSAAIVTGVLQRELGFDGLIVTDAMDMRGVTRDYSPGMSSVMAVKAGVDIVLMPADEESAFASMITAARSGEITAERLDRSVRKILKVKWELGLDTLRTTDPEAVSRLVGSREHWNLARKVARSAMTLVKNDRSALPFSGGPGKRIVSIVLTDTPGGFAEVARPGSASPVEQPGAYFNALLQRRGARVETYRLVAGKHHHRFRRSPRARPQSGSARPPRVREGPDLQRDRGHAAGTPAIPEEGFGVTCPNRCGSLRQSLSCRLIVLGRCCPLCIWRHRAAGRSRSGGDIRGDRSVRQTACSRQRPLRGRGRCGLSQGPPPLRRCGDRRLRSGQPASAGQDRRTGDRGFRVSRGGTRRGARWHAVVRQGVRHVHIRPCEQADRQYDDVRSRVGQQGHRDDVCGHEARTTAVCSGWMTRSGMYLPQFATGPKSAITIRHLITHRAGFPPFRRFFLMCSTATAAVDSVFATELVATPGDTTIYSDIGMITMGKVVEKITGMSLADYVRKEFFEPLGMTRTMYAPPESLAVECAPTEIDTLWRKRLVQGQVHDENAALLEWCCGACRAVFDRVGSGHLHADAPEQGGLWRDTVPEGEHGRGVHAEVRSGAGAVSGMGHEIAHGIVGRNALLAVIVRSHSDSPERPSGPIPSARSV